MRDNVIKSKSYQFALKVVKVARQLSDQKEYVLSRHLLRSGTSIGANIEEATQAQSTADFIHKLSIAQKESFESNYWIRLLRDSELIPDDIGTLLLTDCEEIQRIITSILKTTKAKKRLIDN